MNTLLSRMTVLAASGAVAVAGLMATAAPAGASATPPGCGNSSLAVTHTPLDGATGHDSFVLLYRNVGRGTCTLYGYPGLDAVNASGQVLAHARRTLHGFAGGAPAVSPVAVAPGGYASAVVEWTNFNTATGGACAFSRSVATTPANTSGTVHFPVSVGVCNLQVHPTVAGTTRNVRFAAAQLAWIQGAGASSARQGLYWGRAVASLQLDGAEYASEISTLRQLISLPDADQTPTQNAHYRHDIAALDDFFGTAGLYR